MKTAVDQVIHSAIKKDAHLNLLYMGYDGWFESLLLSPEINFYCPQDATLYERNAQLPINFTLMPKGMNYIPNRIDIDGVVCNSRVQQVQSAFQIAESFHVPLILIEHELPMASSKEKLRRYVNSRLPRCTKVCTHNLVKEEWFLEDTKVIPYGFPVAGNNIKNNKVLVVGDYHQADYGMLNTMMSCHSTVVGLGYNNGLTQEYKSYKDVFEHMTQSDICVVASQGHKPPLIALFAMAAGCVVVTNKTRWSERLITHEKDGILFEKSSEIKKVVRHLLQHESLVDDISLAARQNIRENHPHKEFVDGYINLIKEKTKEVYVR